MLRARRNFCWGGVFVAASRASIEILIRLQQRLEVSGRLKRFQRGE